MASIDHAKAYEARRSERERSAQFEILAALVHAHLRKSNGDHCTLDLITLATQHSVTVSDLVYFLEQYLRRLDFVLSHFD